LKLRTKLALLLAAGGVVLGLVMTLVSTYLLTDKVQEEQRKKAVAVTHLLASGISRSLVAGDAGGVREHLLEALQEIDEARYGFVVGFDGEIIAHSFEGGFPADLLEANIIPHGQSSRTAVLSTTSGTLTDFGVRVIDGSRAELHLGLTHLEFRRELRTIAAVIIGFSLTFMVIVTFVVVSLVNVFTKPIARLSEAAASFGDTGKYTTVPVTSDDEAGRLTDSFNHMARTLGESLERVEKSEHRYRTLIELAQEGRLPRRDLPPRLEEPPGGPLDRATGTARHPHEGEGGGACLHSRLPVSPGRSRRSSGRGIRRGHRHHRAGPHGRRPATRPDRS
jgi:hypothetical protein